MDAINIIPVKDHLKPKVFSSFERDEAPTDKLFIIWNTFSSGCRMIKIGCCAYSYREPIKKGEMTIEGFIEEARKIRLDGVELTGYYFRSTEKPYLYELKRLCLEKGLPISMVSCGAHLWSAKKEERENAVDEIKRWIDITHELGAPCLRVFGGRWPPPPEYAAEWRNLEQAIEAAVEVGKVCADYGASRGVVVALENHGGITRFADDVVRIIENVDSKWFKLNLDTGNYRDYTYEDLEKSIPYTVHIHAKVTVKGRMGPVKLDYERIRRMLEDAEYNGWISIEYEEAEHPSTGVPRFVEYLRKVFP